MNVTIYHNPRCSKSRATLALLQEHDITPEVVDYLNTPPDIATLQHILTLLGMTPRELMRKNEDEYAALGLDDASLSDATLLAAMLQNPKLIERPIVVVDDVKAAIGRPPGQVAALFGWHG